MHFTFTLLLLVENGNSALGQCIKIVLHAPETVQEWWQSAFLRLRMGLPFIIHVFSQNRCCALYMLTLLSSWFLFTLCAVTDDKLLMDEKERLYYPYILELHDEFYEVLLKAIDDFVRESTDASFQCFRREAERVIRRKRHITASKVRLSYVRADFLREIHSVLWENSLEYRPLREVILGCEDKGLMKKLQQYENLLRAKGETIIYNCKREQQRNLDLYIMLKAKHETTLATLIRVQEFLVNDVGLDDAIFTGFREGCIELYFRLSPETTSISMGCLHSSACRLKLLKLGVSKVELSGHWGMDTASGRVTYLKVGMNCCVNTFYLCCTVLYKCSCLMPLSIAFIEFVAE